MKLLYATSIDLPSTRANRLQITSMSEAFARLLNEGFVLGLHSNKGKPLKFLSIEMPQSRSVILAWQYLSVARKEGCTHIYCREEKLLFLMMLYNELFFRLPLKFFYELHHFWHSGWWFNILIRNTDGIIAITHGLRTALEATGYKRAVLVAPDAVDLAKFDVQVSKEEARRELSLPGGFLLAYTGTIDEPWKGAGVVYEAAKSMSDTQTVIVGGKPHYVEEFNRLHPPAPNVFLAGHQPHEKMPMYLKAADALALPNSGKTNVSAVSTSPMKLFEYMASGRPIIASDIQSLREVLNERNALMIRPDSPEALAEGMRTLRDNPELGARLAAQARRDVEQYTWDKRASEILGYISA